MRVGIGGPSIGIGGGVGIGGGDALSGGNPNAAYTGGTTTNSSGVVPVIAANGSASGSIGSGQASLLLLDAAIIGLIVFYIWTRNVQRGG